MSKLYPVHTLKTTHNWCDAQTELSHRVIRLPSTPGLHSWPRCHFSLHPAANTHTQVYWTFMFPLSGISPFCWLMQKEKDRTYLVTATRTLTIAYLWFFLKEVILIMNSSVFFCFYLPWYKTFSQGNLRKKWRKDVLKLYVEAIFI